MNVHSMMRFWRLAMTVCLCAPAFAMAADECLRCHEALGGSIPALFRKDVHHTRGITCAGCHGGNAATDDMTKAMDTSAGFIGVPRGNRNSAVCASCHSDSVRMKSFSSSLHRGQWEDLQASVHGKASGAGGNRAVQCTSCHGAHGITRVKDASSPVSPLQIVKTCSSCHADVAFMRRFNPSLPVDQLEKYRTSVHGSKNTQGDPKVAQCASCHGAHAILLPSDPRSRVNPVNLPGTCARCHSDAAYMKPYGIPTDQYEKFASSVHGVALLQRHDAGAPACNSCHGNHGAVPPGVASISNVCGTCHALNAELFAGSVHKAAFDAQSLPECETCHGNHGIVAADRSLLGLSDGAVCGNCHSEGSNDKGFRAAQHMRAMVDSLATMEETARSLVDEAEQKGMEISEAKFRLRDVRQLRLEAGTVVHAFDEARLRAVAEKGIAAAVSIQQEGREAIDEFYFRRIGLGISTLTITTIAVCLWLLIRRIEKKRTGSAVS